MGHVLRGGRGVCPGGMVTTLPTGVVTLLFTGIEGSTKLLDEVGEARHADALAEHRTKLRDAFQRHGR
jgi:class 3 adenylate cyclase